MNRIEPLDSALDFGRDPVFLLQPLSNRILQIHQKRFELFSFRNDGFLKLLIGFGFEIAEGEIFELAANQPHSQAMGDGRVYIERLPRNALLLLGLKKTERAHVCAAGPQASPQRRERR